MTDQAHTVVTRLAYLAPHEGRTAYTVYPPSSGRKSEVPPTEYRDMRVEDGRTPPEPLSLDVQGFMIARQTKPELDYLDPEAVKKSYFPQAEALVKEHTGALHVLAFDHNIRSVERAARGEPGVRAPVDGVHGDYTVQSGPRRIRELLEANGLAHLLTHRAALINVWRPLRGPVQDVPLGVCDARSVAPADLVDTAIDHYLEDNLESPHLSGQIYSVRHNPQHRWFYVSDMQPHETLLLKGYDTRNGDTARFTPHTGFANPACPPRFLPRESIEVRTVAIYPELRTG